METDRHHAWVCFTFLPKNVEAAFRYIPVDIPDLATLGHGQTVDRLCDIPQGLILVTGIT